MSRSYVLFAFLLFVQLTGYAQELKNLGIDSPWNKGTVTLNDNSILRGEIRHNEIQGSFTFRTNEATDDQKFLQPSEVFALEYVDADENTTRNFYWLAVKNTETGDDIVDFYEVIKVCKDFVVVSKKNKLQAQRDQQNYAVPVGNGYMPSSTSALTLSQIEQFYFLRENGSPELYLTMEYAYVDATLYKYKRNTGYVSDKTIFPKYMGVHWSGVSQHLKKNRIRLDNRKGIITALNYYTDLLETRY